MNNFENEWNLKIRLICSSESELDRAEYVSYLIMGIGLARLTEKEHPKYFKVNKVIRDKLAQWSENFSQYQLFVDGCWLLMQHYDTSNLLKSDYWTLVELHRRWSSLINISFFYGNRYQIENFVPFASKIVTDLVTELLRRKKKLPLTKVDRPTNWRLDAKQVKAQIDPLKVFEYYLPDMKKNGRYYKATCLWHEDKHPSLVVYPEGHCHCHSCNMHQDTYGIIMDQEKCDFATAIARAVELGG